MSRASSSARVLADTAPIFAALGDELRLRLVARLSSEGPLSTLHLGEGAQVTRQAITKHLEVLGAAGLVSSSRAGRERIWELEPRRLVNARAALDRVAADWDDALLRLKAFVETDDR